jgi:hypothetical protein
MNAFHRDLFLLAGKFRSSAISQLVSMNATQSVVKIVMQQQVRDAPLPDTFMLEILWLLAQLAQRGNGNGKQNQIWFLLFISNLIHAIVTVSYSMVRHEIYGFSQTYLINEVK